MRRLESFCIPVFSWLVLLAAALAPLPPAPALAADPPRSAPAGGDSAYAEDLIARARGRALHEDRYWHTLLHYKRGVTGLRSLVDDPRFFAAPEGSHDPAAELAATIRAFFQPEVPDAKHPVCRFIARYTWLKEQLGLDPARLPVNECEHFTDLIREIKPESTTLVFPASHMNSPASMFGHTFLTYEAASRSKLLAHAVNYSALTNETFGPFFAVKGIFGLYPGKFSVLPYYGKLQEYADIDHRDMWEYPLTFTREETIRSLMHVYELDGIYSSYYFFDENCSYALLFLLDAGRPSLALTDDVRPWVIPLDTVRAAERAGLIATAIYRPSKTTLIQHLASRVDRRTRLLAVDVARGRAGPEQIVAAALSADEQARAYDLAVEYLQYLYARREVESGVYTQRFVTLLAARSALGAAGGLRPQDIPPPPRPEEGHRSARAQVGVGLRHDQLFQEFRLRAAYHSLGDYARGYGEGSQIVFGEAAVRYYVEDHRVVLQSLDVVDIVSLTPRDELFKPLSWKVRAGLAQHVMEDGRDHLVGRLTPGVGLAYRLPVVGLGYAMLETDLNVGEDLDDKYALGIGGTVGILRRVTERWTVSLSARGVYYGLGDEHPLLEVTLLQSYALTPNLAVSLDVTRNKTREFYYTEGKLALSLFF
jgi:hypothetical protein